MAQRMAKSWLPNELFAEVILILPTADQATLCLVSKLFNELATRLLYRTIILNSAFQARLCCRTLTTNQVRAESVRTFRVTNFPMSLPPWSELFSDAVKSLVHVKELGLRLRSPACHDILEAGSFPQLRIFSVTLSTLSNGLLLPSFLNRHPGIVNLRLYRDYSSPPVPSISVHLPNLCSYRGPTSFFTSIAAQAPISDARLSWNTGENFEPPIAALESHNKESLVRLTCGRRGYNADLIDCISRHIPDIQSLHIQSPGRTGIHSTDKTTWDAIELSLSNFTSLRHLNYCFSRTASRGIAVQHTVKAWSRACPTLTRIDLYGLSCKREDDTWAWEP